ncbi:MAG: chromosomal replication initiator protein DnaA [Rectinema sp.]|nr:chromosomal replication initiator protein DnaA [Rectinema sp.]
MEIIQKCWSLHAMAEEVDEVVWQKALEIAKARVPESEFIMWFRLGYLGFDKGTIHLSATNMFLRDQFVRKYSSMMKQILAELLGMDVALEVIAASSNAASLKNHAPSIADPVPSLIKERLSRPIPSASNHENHEDIRIQREPKDNGRNNSSKSNTLQSRYTFENFVVGENSNFAFNAAVAVADNPGTSYNPLLIYGGVGLGKTHLMHAIGNRIAERHPDMRVICVTAEDFTNEFIKTIHDRTTNEFKNKYRNIDVLLIDDIHFFQSKHGVQEELFHTFNALYDSNRQLVFTCDRPASELKDFSERLKSRFMMGLKTDLTLPGFETRVAIIRKKLELYRRQLPEDVIELIAHSIETNVRDLDSCISQIFAYADLIKVDPTFDTAQNVIRQMTNAFKPASINVSSIIRTVADFYKLSTSDLKGKKRSKNIALARQVAMYIIRETTDYSTTEIGSEFSGRDHTTVMHSCQKIEDLIKFDAHFASVIQRLIHECKQNSSS